MLLFSGPLTYQWVRTRFSTSNWPETLQDPSTRISELQCSRNLVPSWVRWVCGCMCGCVGVCVCVWGACVCGGYMCVCVCVCVCGCVGVGVCVCVCVGRGVWVCVYVCGCVCGWGGVCGCGGVWVCVWVGACVCVCGCVYVCVWGWVHVCVCVCVRMCVVCVVCVLCVYVGCVCVATSPFVIMCMFTAGAVPRVMSLRNPEQKMSKSDPSELSRITLLDTPEQIKSKIAKAMTDSISSLSYDPTHRPGVSNLISLYGSVSGLDTSSVCAQFEGKQSVDLKNELGDLLVEELSPLRKKTMDLLENKEYVKDILSKGSVKAKEMASALLNEVKEIIGIS